LGGVFSDIQQIVDKTNKKMSPGNTVVVQGVANDMELAFSRLALGFIFALILIYFILVINFQSWLDPFIIIMALPGAVSGMVWMLFLTHTTFSVPSLMGTIMSLGVATTNSILIVTFAGMALAEGKPCQTAVYEAGKSRLRPVLMTALAMIVGMIPMALGLGEGGEQNAPLGRAVVGGLLAATMTTLFFVPIVYSYFRKKPNPYTITHLEDRET
jgi:multidrug efflux pump subunit AcrB